jgi:hypothetical protein
MMRFSLCLLVTMLLQGLCYADVTKLSAEHRAALQDPSHFREINATANLPPTVVALCVDDSGRLAEPGQKWEPTDFITDSTLPRKRLIWAAVGGEYYVVHYERGGFAHSFHVLVATLKRGDAKPQIVWRGVGDQMKDFRAFLDALNSNRLDDRLDYAH